MKRSRLSLAAAAGAGFCLVALLGAAPEPPPLDPLDPLSCATLRPGLPESLSRALDLRFSPSMLDSTRGGWSPSSVDAFAQSLLYGSGDARPGALARVWSYYGVGDLRGEPLHWNVRKRSYSRVRVDVYLPSDCCTNRCGEGGCPSSWPDSCREGGWVECNGYGVYRGGNWLMFAGGSCPDEIPQAPEELARSPVFAHELAHMAHQARDPYLENSFSELLATGAEYLIGERWNQAPPIPRSAEFDVSLKTGSEENNRCAGREVLCKYNQFRLWNAYLFAHHSGEADSLDLVYRWLRRAGSSGTGSSGTGSSGTGSSGAGSSGTGSSGAGSSGTGPTWRGLGEVLLEAPFAAAVPGISAGDKLGTLYQRYAIARYADAPAFEDGRFGFGPGVSTRILRLFEWPDTLALPRRRVMPPVVHLAPGESRRITAWRDPIQPWMGEEPCRVLTTGTDYVIVLADSATVAARAGATLRAHIVGLEAIPPNQSFRWSVIAYAHPDSALHRGQPLEIREEGLPASAAASDTLRAALDVEGFGDRIQGVVLVFSMVEQEPSERFDGVEAMDYSLELSFEAPPGAR